MGDGALPAQLTRFFGREAELAELLGSLDHERLVSLVGAPGCGKTRLVVEAAAHLAPSFLGGVRFVELASIADPLALAAAVAEAADVPEEAGRPVDETLVESLRAASPTLLVLDNCEHLVDGVAALVQRLVSACPPLRVMTTSRLALGLPGERVWSLGPLDPDAAAALFADRAQRAAGDFRPEDERAFVERICAQLDGLPLAIELVAAWTRVLSARQIRDRLEATLPWLASGARGRTPRHETMTATVDWSYRLLDPPVQRLFDRLSVFAGGFDLEAVEAVAGSPVEGDDVLDELTTLIDHSLVVASGGGGGESRRYRLLEPVRQCGLALLAASGEQDAVRRRHADHYLAIARDFEIWDVLDAKAANQLQRLRQDEGNLLAVRDWARIHAPDLLLPVTQVFGALWERGSHVGEGQAWLDDLLADDTIDPALRVRVLLWTARLAWRERRYDDATRALDESCALAGPTADPSTRAIQLHTRATIANSLGDVDTALRASQEAVAIARRCDHPNMLAAGLVTLAWAFYAAGDGPSGDEQLRLILDDGRQAASGHLEGQVHFGLQYGAFLAGDPARQRTHLVEALRASHRDALVERYAWLGSCGMMAATERRFPAALRLFGGASSPRWGGSRHGTSPDSPVVALFQQAWDAVGPERAQRLLAEGAAMSWDALVGEALAETVDAAPLTARESEIADLVADGLTNAEIAERLAISRRTVDAHLDHIRRKLGLRGRRQIVVWALHRSARS